MATWLYKKRRIFAFGELNRTTHQWQPLSTIFWKTTTQKFHRLNDLAGSFVTKEEAIICALQAGKIWIDSQPPVPPEGREAALVYFGQTSNKGGEELN
jgi:hypothetical protein